MILAICMAGFNTRFHDAGFDVPKYLLPWEKGTIISELLHGLKADGAFSRILLLPNQRDRYFQGDLRKTLEGLPVGEADIHYIPDTRGQAHTAAVAAQLVAAGPAGQAHEPIVFHNADTLLIGRDWSWLGRQLTQRDVYVDVFPASSPAYSYVSLHDGRVASIREKVVISPFASSGLYGFRSAEFYLNAFERHSAGRADDAGETYIADVIQEVVTSGGDVFINELDRDSATVVLGKPEEYGLELARRALAR